MPHHDYYSYESGHGVLGLPNSHACLIRPIFKSSISQTGVRDDSSTGKIYPPSPPPATCLCVIHSVSFILVSSWDAYFVPVIINALQSFHSATGQANPSCIQLNCYIKPACHLSSPNQSSQPPIKQPIPPTCASKSSRNMRFAAAPITVMPSTHARPMESEVTLSGPKKSWWATPVRAIRRLAHNHPHINLPFRTRAMGAEAPPRTTRATPAGDERKPTGWWFWKARANIASPMEIGREERWQYASRVSASVFGAPCALP